MSVGQNDVTPVFQIRGKTAATFSRVSSGFEKPTPANPFTWISIRPGAMKGFVSTVGPSTSTDWIRLLSIRIRAQPLAGMFASTSIAPLNHEPIPCRNPLCTHAQHSRVRCAGA